MLIEHIGLLSWVHESACAQKQKDHAQDGETLIELRSAPGDPAMVLMFRMASILSSVLGTLPCPAAGLLLDAYFA